MFRIGQLTGLRARAGTTALVFALAAGVGSQVPAQDQNGFKEHSGTLADGTSWLIRVPDNWNGRLLRDLDFASFINVPSYAPRYKDLMERGYAFAGLARHPLRLWQYDPQREIRNLEQVQDKFVELERQPDIVLQYGCSGGGLDSLASAEDFPDKIDGSVVLAAHTPVWIMSSFLDGWFAMKALLAPEFEAQGLGVASDLAVVGLPNAGAGGERNLDAIRASWKSAIETAGQTAEGRARLALAFAIGQWSPWMVEGTELPEVGDAAAMGDMIVQSALRIAGNVGGSSRLLFENAASGQQLSGNEGVDYAAFYDNAAPAMKQVVEALYSEAGLDLAQDIATVDAEPRIPVSDYALDFWAGDGRTTTGALNVPTIRIHMLGDWAIPYSLMQGYQALVEAEGTTDLYRQSLVKGTGHCEFMAAESTVIVETLVKRIESGSWPDTDPEALNAAATALNTGSDPRFIEDGEWRLGAYNRPWTPQN
ncbi:hypothetical protein [Arenibacterium halophilum]|uniref:hypothetical protein n=1 Tax=Arenibacterium halophilum TaxID=2583821 RepID=UPI001FEC903E|nr:hypothetical protein [Arenibacterium halophilum]